MFWYEVLPHFWHFIMFESLSGIGTPDLVNEGEVLDFGQKTAI